MLGWLREAAARASRRNLATAWGSGVVPSRSTFTATRRPSSLSVASKTSAVRSLAFALVVLVLGTAAYLIRARLRGEWPFSQQTAEGSAS